MKMTLFSSFALASFGTFASLVPTAGRTATEAWAYAAATNAVEEGVADWAKAGQPQPGGSITDVRTNGVSAVVGGVANITIPNGGGAGVDANTVTNIAASASVTNAGAVTAAAAMTNGVMSYADGRFLTNKDFSSTYNSEIKWNSTLLEITGHGLAIVGNGTGNAFVSATEIYAGQTELGGLGNIVSGLQNMTIPQMQTSIAAKIDAQAATNAAAAFFAANADYATQNLTSEITLRSGEIGNLTTNANFTVTLDFADNGRSGDALLYLVNYGAGDATLTVAPTSLEVQGLGSDWLKAAAATTNLFMFSRVKENTVIVSKQEIK